MISAAIQKEQHAGAHRSANDHDQPPQIEYLLLNCIFYCLKRPQCRPRRMVKCYDAHWRGLAFHLR